MFVNVHTPVMLMTVMLIGRMPLFAWFQWELCVRGVQIMANQGKYSEITFLCSAT